MWHRLVRFLLRVIPFDEEGTGAQRPELDKLAPIKEVLKIFV